MHAHGTILEDMESASPATSRLLAAKGEQEVKGEALVELTGLAENIPMKAELVLGALRASNCHAVGKNW